MSTLRSLHEAHIGKSSDKWDSYLSIYDEIFRPFRTEKISLLEIGIQNGGSIEIWGNYFHSAKSIVGCDINEQCSKLNFDDPRVKLVIGDANEFPTIQKITSIGSPFDIVIDDGSHRSGDIVKSFVNYFPHVKPGGVFVVEDLHCSYWNDFEGGLYHPLSSMAFFKLLLDIVNYEHWGNDKERAEIFSRFHHAYKIDFSSFDFSQVLSIEFRNSICIIRKSINPEGNHLGKRNVGGTNEQVVAGHAALHGSPPVIPNESTNQYSRFDVIQNEAISFCMSRAINEIDELHSYIYQLKGQLDHYISQSTLLDQRLLKLEEDTIENRLIANDALAQHSANLNLGIEHISNEISGISKTIAAQESFLLKIVRKLKGH